MFSSLPWSSLPSSYLRVQVVCCPLPSHCGVIDKTQLKHAHEIAILSTASHPNIIQVQQWRECVCACVRACCARACVFVLHCINYFRHFKDIIRHQYVGAFKYCQKCSFHTASSSFFSSCCLMTVESSALICLCIPFPSLLSHVCSPMPLWLMWTWLTLSTQA